MTVIVFFRDRRRKRHPGHHPLDGYHRIGFACQEHLDAALRQPHQEAGSATGRDKNIEAVKGMSFASGMLMDAHFLWQVELADFKNVTIGGFKDHEPARFSCVPGNSAEILACDANLHA